MITVWQQTWKRDPPVRQAILQVLRIETVAMRLGHLIEKMIILHITVYISKL